ncbi:hypothetical protein ACJZ2D_000164 [Fusarium nematophilum]
MDITHFPFFPSLPNLLNHRLALRPIPARPLPLLMHPQPPISQNLRRRPAPPRHQLPRPVDMLIPHVETVVPLGHRRDQGAPDDGPSRVLCPHDVAVLVVVEARVGSDFAVGGVGGGAKRFAVVEAHLA